MVLTPHIVTNFSGVIWRMEIDESINTICLEIRNAENKSVSFSAVDLDCSKTYFRNLTSPLEWRCGLAAAANGIMLINGHQSEILPVSKGLTALAIKTGETLWANYSLNLEAVTNNGFQVYDARIQPKTVFQIDPFSGKSVKQESYHLHPRSPILNIIYPAVVTGETVKQSGFKHSVYGNTAHLLTHNGYRILSLHALSERSVTQQLFVYNADCNLIFEDIIARDIQKLQPEAFIVYKNKLVWLQNRSVLKVLNL